jgi:hypothetical protein
MFLNKKYKEQKDLIFKSASAQNVDFLVDRLDNLFDLMKEANINNEKDYIKFKNNLKKESIKKHFIKKSYPQAFDAFHIQAPHNLNKWLDTVKNIYNLHFKGYDLGESTELLIKDWDTMEKNDFKNWLKFYQTNQNKSYKIAQFTVGDGIPIDHLIRRTPDFPSKIMDPRNEEWEKLQENSQKQKLERQRQALIGRLNSAEKIVSTNAGNLFKTEAEINSWLETLHSLKRKIQTIKSAATLQDVIIASANKLKFDGLHKTANIIMKIAQEVPSEAVPEDAASENPIPEENQELSQDPMANPEMPEDAGLDLSVPEEDSDEMLPDDDLDDPDGAVREFLENLGVSASDNFDGAIIVVGDDSSINKKAQAVPGTEQIQPPQEINPELSQDLPPEPISETLDAPGEINVEEIEEPEEGLTSQQDEKAVRELTDTDRAIDQAFSNVNYDDIIVKLESLATLFKQRQVIRELTIVDLMLQAVGIASFFPSLGEATKSALDSNQYVLTRVEDILAKLRGASGLTDGTLDQVKDKLETSEENEFKKKENRVREKMQPNADEPNVIEELSGPTKVETVTPEKSPPQPSEKPTAPVNPEQPQVI